MSPVLSWILFYCAENPWYETQPLNCAVCHDSACTGLCNRHLELTHLTWLKCLLVVTPHLTSPAPGNHSCWESRILPSVLDLCVSRIMQCCWLSRSEKLFQVAVSSGSSVLPHVEECPSYFMIEDALHCTERQFPLPVHLSMDVQLISTSWLLWTVLPVSTDTASTFEIRFQFIWNLRCLWASELMELC